MTFTLVTPATQMDLANCGQAVTLQVWALARVQLRLGPSWALRGADGKAVAVAGFCYRSDDTCDAWFMAAPAASRHIGRIVRAIRLTGIPAPYSRAIAFVSTPEGRRIAALAGYERIAVREDGMEVYCYGRIAQT